MARPRKATMRVQHQRSCPNYTKSAINSTGARAGCTCKPSYYVVRSVPKAGGGLRVVRGTSVRSRAEAEKEARRLQVEIDQGRLGVRLDRSDEMIFRDWAAAFLRRRAGEEGGEHPRKQSTIRAYSTTIDYANAAFGDFLLGEVGAAQLNEFAGAIRNADGGGSDATLAKHLRQLSAIFSDALDGDKIASNPVPRFRKKLKLRVPRGSEPYTNDELEMLWATMGELHYRPVYVAICKAAVTTGAREGELIALDWRDLDLTNRRLRIRHTHNPVDGLTLPKDGEPRTLNLIPPAVRVFEEWITACGVQPDDAPIFQTAPGRRVDRNYLSQLVGDARIRAGIPRVGERGRNRKPFHAFRACFARICREAGLDPQWVQTQLGHSSVDLTMNVYGQWAEAGLVAEASKIDAGAFPV